jgi:methylated-DNA-protein-cysteine methyltransferase-like protein
MLIERTNAMNWNSVYELVKKIPRGRVATYGQLAKALKLRGGARSAGRAMAACPSGRGIPWHRVVGAGGRLLIGEPHAGLQRKLLESEGLQVAEKRIRNFPDYQCRTGNTSQSKRRKTRR